MSRKHNEDLDHRMRQITSMVCRLRQLTNNIGDLLSTEEVRRISEMQQLRNQAMAEARPHGRNDSATTPTSQNWAEIQERSPEAATQPPINNDEAKGVEHPTYPQELVEKVAQRREILNWKLAKLRENKGSNNDTGSQQNTLNIHSRQADDHAEDVREDCPVSRKMMRMEVDPPVPRGRASVQSPGSSDAQRSLVQASPPAAISEGSSSYEDMDMPTVFDEMEEDDDPPFFTPTP